MKGHVVQPGPGTIHHGDAMSKHGLSVQRGKCLRGGWARKKIGDEDDATAAKKRR